MKLFVKPILFLQALFVLFGINQKANLNELDSPSTSLVRKQAITSDSYFKDIEEVASSLSRQQLFSRLQKKVNENWVRQGYNALDEGLVYTDFVDDGYMVDIYSNTSRLKASDTGNYHQEGDTWNKEHLIPKSWWGGDKGGPNGEGGDMFNMYPTDGYINGMRSNYPFGETTSPTRVSNNSFSKLGPSSFSGYNGTVFEPNDIWKGNVARSYFYFALKYVTYTSSSYTSGNGSIQFNKNGNYGLTDYSTNLFLSWNKHLEKNDYEKERAYRIYDIQKNLNPFTFHPEWADYIWGNIPLTSVDPTSITLDETSSRVRLGETLQLTCTILPSNADKNVIWSSSNDEVASVNETGLVQANGLGACEIEVRSEKVPSLLAKGTIEVHNDKVDLVSISLPSSIEVGLNETKDIEISFAPKDASNKDIDIEIADPSIAKVGPSKVTGLKEGSTTLTVSSVENPSIKASTTITITSEKKFKLATSSSDLIPGNKFVIANREKGTVAGAFSSKYLISNSATFPSDSIDNYKDTTSIFTLIDNKDGTYGFRFENGDYLSSSSGDSLSLNGVNNKWSISFNEEKAVITNSKYPTYPLLFNVSAPRYKTYSNVNSNQIYPSIYIEKGAYIDQAKEEANKYASSFLEKTSSYCQKENVPSSLWDELKQDYLLLSLETTNYIRSNTTSDDLSSFIARYSFIINKYGYEDFIFDSQTSSSNLLNGNNNDLGVISIALVSVILLSSSLLLLVKTKRKNH